MKQIHIDAKYKVMIQKAEDKELIYIKINKKTYKVHPLIAYFLGKHQSGQKMYPLPVELKGFSPILDCMHPSKGEPISVFTLCENSTDSAEMLQALMHVTSYTVSPTTLHFIEQSPELRISAGLNLCKPFYNLPKGLKTIPELELCIARAFLRLSPSASVLKIMARANTIALSLLAHTSGVEIKTNTEYVLKKEQILDELRKNPDLIGQLSPAFKVLALLLIEQLEEKQLEDFISVEEAKDLFELLYPADRRDCTLRAELRQLIAAKIIPMYHSDFLSLALKSPRKSFLFDFDLFQPYLNEQQILEIIINFAMDYWASPKKILDSANIKLLQERLNKSFEIGVSVEDNFWLFSSLLKMAEKKLLSSEFIDAIHCLNNTANISSLFQFSLDETDPITLYNHLMTLPEFLPYLIECVSSLDREIKSRVSSTLTDDQYHRLLELLDTAQYKEGSQQLKLLLICFYGTLFQPQHLRDLASHVGLLNFDVLDQVFFNIEEVYKVRKLNTALICHQGVRVLLEANPRACTQYYLSGLKDAQHSNRAKWLHIYGFKIDLPLIEHLLKKEHVVGDQVLTVKRVLTPLKETLRSFALLTDNKKFSITPLDQPLEEALINLFETYQSQITPYLPTQTDLQPYELCIIRLFYRLGIARENQSVPQYCAQLRDANPSYNGLNDTDILKVKLSTLLETSSHERVILCLLVKADQDVCDTLLQIYSWAYYQSEYQIPPINQMYDLLVHSLNQTSMQRDAVAFSLTQSKQLTDLQAQVTDLTQLIQQQNLMLTKLVHQASNPEDASNRRPGFFTS